MVWPNTPLKWYSSGQGPPDRGSQAYQGILGGSSSVLQPALTLLFCVGCVLTREGGFQRARAFRIQAESRGFHHPQSPVSASPGVSRPPGWPCTSLSGAPVPQISKEEYAFIPVETQGLFLKGHQVSLGAFHCYNHMAEFRIPTNPGFVFVNQIY